MQGQGEQEAGVDRHHGEDAEDGQAHPGMAQHPGCDQRGATAPGQPRLVSAEQPEQQRGSGQRQPGPHRPVLLLPEHQRHRQHRHGRAQQHQSGQVERAGPPLSARAAQRQHAASQYQQQDAHRHVDQEHRPPARAEEIGADQHAARDLPGGRADGEDRRIGAERPGPRLAGERALDQAEHLRDGRRRTGPLHQTEDDQLGRPLRQAAGERGRGEQGDAGEMHPAVAEAVAEPGTGDHQNGVGDGVTGDDQLQIGACRMEFGTDGGGGDVHDEDVEGRHEQGGEQDREEQPGPVVSAGCFTVGDG